MKYKCFRIVSKEKVQKQHYKTYHRIENCILGHKHLRTCQSPLNYKLFSLAEDSVFFSVILG